MLSRLNGPLSSIQSPALRLPRWSPPPTSVDGGRVRAGLVEDVLDLLALLADLVLADGGQRRDAARAAVVGVRRADHAEHVAAVRDVVRDRSAGRRVQPVAVASAWPCVSWPSTNVTSTSRAVDRPVLRVGDRDRERDVVAEGERPALDRRGDRHRRRGVADRDRRVRRADLAARVDDRQLRRVTPARRVGVRRVRLDRVDRAVAVEVPLEADRVARIGVVRARAREVDGQRRGPSVVSAVRTATGARWPLTYSHRTSRRRG